MITPDRGDEPPQAGRMESGAAGRRAGTTNSVSRAIALLNSFSLLGPELNLTQLAERTGLSKSTALRLLNTMRDADLIRRTGTTYILGERLIELGVAAGSTVSATRRDQLRDVAMPFLQDLYAQSGQTVHLAVLDGPDVVYLEKLFGHSRVRSPSRVGARCNAACTAVGKAILASSDETVVENVIRNLRPLTRHSLATPSAVVRNLSRVRREGSALDNQEAHLGLTCCAVPVLTRRQGCVAPVSVAGAVGVIAPGPLVHAIRRATASIGRALDAAQPACATW